MRTLYFVLALLSCIGVKQVSAADVEFECDATMFEEPAGGDEVYNRRFTIEGHPNLDSPLYEGLWPMTLDAFHGSKERTVPREFKFAFPVNSDDDHEKEIEQPHVVPAGMVIASGRDDWRYWLTNYVIQQYDSPLYDGLWPMTVERFKRADMERDQEVFSFTIASNSVAH
jgi:hypothetical protein